MVPLPQEGGIKDSFQKLKLLFLIICVEGSLLRELAAEGRLKECPPAGDAVAITDPA